MDAPSRTTLRRQVWTAAPSDGLRPYVRSFIAQAIDVPPGESASLTVAATVYPVLVVTYAGHVQSSLHHDSAAAVPEVALSGPLPSFYVTTLRGRPCGFFVQLEPTAPLALFGVDGAAYALGLAAGGVAGPSVAPRLEAWGRDVAAAGDEGAAFADRIARTERLLADLLASAAHAARRERASSIARMAAHVLDTDGTLRVSAVADALGVGVSTLRRRFRADLGMAPKLFSAIVRFRHALAYLHTHPGASWAGVAARFGYADQSHLIRDYKRFAGVVPSRWDDAERFIDLTFGILRSDR